MTRLLRGASRQKLWPLMEQCSACQLQCDWKGLSPPPSEVLSSIWKPEGMSAQRMQFLEDTSKNTGQVGTGGGGTLKSKQRQSSTISYPISRNTPSLPKTPEQNCLYCMINLPYCPRIVQLTILFPKTHRTKSYLKVRLIPLIHTCISDI